MVLKSLEGHNKEAREHYRDMDKYPRSNGLACPNCGRELMDSDPMMLTSSPPQRNVHCSGCGFIGYRVA